MKQRVLFLLAILILPLHLKAADRLVYCSEASPETLSPVLASSMTAVDASQPLYDSLLEVDRRTSKIVPALASSWKKSNDGLVYTFQLRKDVAFHTTTTFKPTRNMNADDVVFSYNRFFKADHPFHKVGKNFSSFNSYNLADVISQVKKVDDYTVQFLLKKPLATFIEFVPFNGVGAIYSSEYGAQVAKSGQLDKLDLEPVGTGAFQLVSFERDQAIRYKANETYYRGASKIKSLVFQIIPEASVRQQKLTAGECDIAFQPALADIPALAAKPNLQLVKREGLNMGYIVLNVQKKPFDNALVRQAIAHALNRKAYIDAIYLGYGKVLNAPVPEVSWGSKPNPKAFEYDPELSKKLLKQAGFNDGFDTTLWALPVTRAYNPNGKKLAEMMQSDLGKVGIRVKIVSYDWGTYLDKSAKGEHEMLQLGWSDVTLDPDAYLYPTLSCESVKSAENRWCNKEFDSKINKARFTSNLSLRKKLYFAAQEVFAREVPLIPIATSEVLQVTSKRVANFVVSPDGGVNFYGVTVK